MVSALPPDQFGGAGLGSAAAGLTLRRWFRRRFDDAGPGAEVVLAAPAVFGADRSSPLDGGSAVAVVVPAAPVRFGGTEPSPDLPRVCACASFLGDPS